MHFVIPTIYEYLTITECFNFYQTCKEFKILIPNNIWKTLILRDFYIDYPSYLQKYQDTFFARTCIPDIKFALGLDNCIICNFCKVINSRCLSTCIIKQNTVSKTTCKTKYKLSDNELKLFKPEIKYNNYYKKNITLYKVKDIKRYICKKYTGITNFALKNYIY